MSLTLINNGGIGSFSVLNRNNVGGSFQAISSEIQSIPLYVTSGLVLNLDAAEYGGSGNWLDLTLNGNDGTAVQSPTYSSNQGGYFDFDGGSITATGQVDSFSIPDGTTLDTMTSMSIEMWINIDTVQGTTSPNLLLSKRGTTSNGYIGFFTSASYTFRIGTASPTQFSWSVPPVTGSWQQLLLTVSGSGSKLYRNGSLVQDSPSYTGNFANINTSANLLIGDVNPNATGIYGFDGKISIVRIYNTALTSTQVTQNYDSQKTRFGL